MDRDPVKAIQALERGLKKAYADNDWAGYASLVHTMYQSFELLEEDYFAYRSLKLGRSVLRRNEAEHLSVLLAKLELRLRGQVSSKRWIQMGERLMREMTPAQ